MYLLKISERFMKKIFMFVNVDWFFYSHRLPIAKAAGKNNIEMDVYTDFTQNQICHIHVILSIQY